MTPADYIATARKLLAGSVSDVDTRRALSTACYALFHQLCREFKQCVFGEPAVGGADLSDRVYRFIDHRLVKLRCNDLVRFEKAGAQPHLPVAIGSFAERYVNAQEARLNADYNPTATVTVAEALVAVDEADRVLQDFSSTSAADRRAFVMFVCLPAKAR